MDNIVVVVDRSGSMELIKGDAEGGLNSLLNEQKKMGEARLTLAQFDGEYDVVYGDTDLKLFEGYTLVPRGMTALLDAVGRTAASVQNSKVSGKKIFVIVTDGHENASREWTNKMVLDKINEMKKDDWDFIFLAADEATLENAKHWGMAGEKAFTFDGTGDGNKVAYDTISTYATSVRGGVSREEATLSFNNDISKNSKLKLGT